VRSIDARLGLRASRVFDARASMRVRCTEVCA